MQSLYRRYPVGSLLVWATRSEAAEHRGDRALAPGVVKLLLDGQQRITSLYGIIHGRPPEFFDGNPDTFSGLHFHLAKEEFAFYSPIKMRDDRLWVDVSKLMMEGITPWLGLISEGEDGKEYIKRLNELHTVQGVDFHVEEVTGTDKTIDVVVDIFNRVNSGGTKLSKGDLALAKICAELPTARDSMRESLSRWRDAGYHFNLDWLLRNINTVVTGEAKFNALHDIDADTFLDGFKRAESTIDYLLNLIGGRLGLDHDRVFAGRYALPVMTHYLDRRGGSLVDAVEQDQLLFWYLQSAMWGRFSGSTETMLDQELRVIEEIDGALDRLIEGLRLWRGGLRVVPDHFGGWSRGARFYPVIYLLTRVGEARDWGTGMPLKSGMPGKMSALELHHIFPKNFLYGHRYMYKRPQVNAVANFCFLTKDTNLQISDADPAIYLDEIEQRHPGALASQWIPMDPQLWQGDNYLDFLEARKELLARAINRFLDELRHGASDEEEELAPIAPSLADFATASMPLPRVGGGIESDDEEEQLRAVNDWIGAQGLPEGAFLYELVDEQTGAPIAILDLAWPTGLQEEYSQPVALLMDESAELLALANARGFRCYTSIESFKQYVQREVLALEPA